MIKYTDYYITFQEVPDEVTLTLTISRCQHHCPGCHSPWLQTDCGKDLIPDLRPLIERYKDDITCVCFMGEGDDHDALAECISIVRSFGLKSCLYTGGEEADFQPALISMLDYLKTGDYRQELGGLDKPTTNQRMYRCSRESFPVDIGKNGLIYDVCSTLEDITPWFRRKRI